MVKNMTDAQKRVIAAKIAKELWLAHPTRWAFAKDAMGKEVDLESPEATCWCAIGAIAKARRYCGTHFSGKSLSNSIGLNASILNDTGRLTVAHWDTWITELEAEAANG